MNNRGQYCDVVLGAVASVQSQAVSERRRAFDPFNGVPAGGPVSGHAGHTVFYYVRHETNRGVSRMVFRCGSDSELPLSRPGFRCPWRQTSE